MSVRYCATSSLGYQQMPDPQLPSSFSSSCPPPMLELQFKLPPSETVEQPEPENCSPPHTNFVPKPEPEYMHSITPFLPPTTSRMSLCAEVVPEFESVFSSSLIQMSSLWQSTPLLLSSCSDVDPELASAPPSLSVHVSTDFEHLCSPVRSEAENQTEPETVPSMAITSILPSPSPLTSPSTSEVPPVVLPAASEFSLVSISHAFALGDSEPKFELTSTDVIDHVLLPCLKLSSESRKIMPMLPIPSLDIRSLSSSELPSEEQTLEVTPLEATSSPSSSAQLVPLPCFSSDRLPMLLCSPLIVETSSSRHDHPLLSLKECVLVFRTLLVRLRTSNDDRGRSREGDHDMRQV